MKTALFFLVAMVSGYTYTYVNILEIPDTASCSLLDVSGKFFDLVGCKSVDGGWVVNKVNKDLRLPTKTMANLSTGEVLSCVSRDEFDIPFVAGSSL